MGRAGSERNLQEFETRFYPEGDLELPMASSQGAVLNLEFYKNPLGSWVENGWRWRMTGEECGEGPDLLMRPF